MHDPIMPEWSDLAERARDERHHMERDDRSLDREAVLVAGRPSSGVRSTGARKVR